MPTTMGVADSLAHAGGVGLRGIRMLCATRTVPHNNS